ncbi:MAG TPA: hypothetical protein VLL08_19465 [Kineosporiaceae bacterium]|nr:hypothetical protein [Kineosporiaceae bacterium]
MNRFVEPPPVDAAELLATVVGVEVAPAAGSVDGLVPLGAWVVETLAIVAVGEPA